MLRLRRYVLCSTALLGLSMLLLPGCGEGLSADAEQARQEFLLTARPSGEQTVKSIREALTEGKTELDVVLIGRIDGGQMPAFEEGKAAFLFADGIGHGGTDHDPFACKFCSKNPENYAATVQFEVDGKVLATDARNLFGVKERQKVMINGKATLDSSDETNLLAIKGTGIFLVPDK